MTDNNEKHTYTIPDGPKKLRETLCVVQEVFNRATYDTSTSRHSAQLQRLIDECDRKRPLDSSGKHGDLHTDECGCEDKLKKGAPLVRE